MELFLLALTFVVGFFIGANNVNLSNRIKESFNKYFNKIKKPEKDTGAAGDVLVGEKNPNQEVK